MSLKLQGKNLQKKIGKKCTCVFNTSLLRHFWVAGLPRIRLLLQDKCPSELRVSVVRFPSFIPAKWTA